MHILPAMVDAEILALEQRASDAGVNMASVLRECGVAESTWFRWRKSGIEPRLKTLRKVQAALDTRLKGSDEQRPAA